MVEQAEQPEPKRGRPKWPWLLVVVALVGIGWAGLVWDASQNEFAFLESLHPTKVQVHGDSRGPPYTMLVFSKEAASRVRPLLQKMLLPPDWQFQDWQSQTDISGGTYSSRNTWLDVYGPVSTPTTANFVQLQAGECAVQCH